MGSFSGMTEGIIMALLFVILAGFVLGNFNDDFGQSYDLGLDVTGLDAFETSTQTAYDATTGEVTQTSDGLTLLSSWKMFKGLSSTVWSFINGDWIQNLIVNVLMLDSTAGYAIAMVLRILFLGLILWTIIKIFFKVDA